MAHLSFLENGNVKTCCSQKVGCSCLRCPLEDAQLDAQLGPLPAPRQRRLFGIPGLNTWRGTVGG